MKKNIFVVLFLFGLASTLSAQIKQEDLIGKNNRLYFSFVGETRFYAIYVEFKDENTYTFCSPFGGYLWGTYDYKLEGNTIYLAVTNDKNPFSSNEDLNKLFSSNNSNKYVDFVYDSNFSTFTITGGFRHENILLSNSKYAKPTPQGTESLIGNYKVIKKSGYLVPTENLKVRIEPNTKSDTGIIDYNYELMGMIEDEYRGSGQFNADYETMFVQYETKNLSILLAGMIRSFDAVTVEKQTIDGITAPWYRIDFTDNEEGATRYYWVFGGYIKEVSDPKTKEYEQLFINSAVQKELLKKIRK